MDNIFEILLALIILSSGIIEPLLRKRRKKNQEQKNTGTKKSDKDILSELFGVTPVETKQSESSVGFIDEENQEGTWSPEDDFQDSFEPTVAKQTTAKVHTKTDYAQIRSDLHNQVSEIYKDEKTVKSSKLLLELKTDLSNSESFRKAFLVSEILGKPKALKR